MKAVRWAWLLVAGAMAAAGQTPIPFTSVTPCRIMDTRTGAGQTGAFGAPALDANSTRTVPVPQHPCGIPPGASAYSLNITVVPSGPLQYLTVYPAGQARPLVSTLNSFDGRIVANAALVPAGSNGAIDLFVTDRTDVIIDINGYFGGTAQQQMRFFPVTPCRITDTRVGGGQSGVFGPPTPTANTERTINIPQHPCGIPADARAYSLNITVVPGTRLQYLTIFPAGQLRPLASTLNSFEGRIVANAAIVPAGTNGGVTYFVTDQTDVIIDINGYFRVQ